MSEAVDPGQGYRLLKEGEEIRATDECLDAGVEPWTEIGVGAVGYKWGEDFHPIRRRLESPEAAPAEGVDLESIAPNLIELTRGEPHDDEDCPEDDTCRCANIRTLNAECKALQAALSRSEAAPKAAEAEQAMIELRKRIVKRGFTNHDADEVMSDLIDLGWRPRAPESQPHTVHPVDRLEEKYKAGEVIGWSLANLGSGFSLHIAATSGPVSALAPTLSEAVQAAVEKLPLGVRP